MPGGKKPTLSRQRPVGAGHRRHVVLLAHRPHQRAAVAGLSKGGCRWLKRPQPIRPVGFGMSITTLRLRLAAAAGRRSAPPTSPSRHSAAPPRRSRHRGDDPLDAIDMHPLRPGGPTATRLLARDVVGEALVDEAAALDPLIRLEAEGAAADHLGHLLRPSVRARRSGMMKRAGGRLGQRIQQGGEGAVQPDQQRPVVRRAPLRHRPGQHLAEAVPHRPALQRGDAIPRPNRSPSWKRRPVAQPDRDAAAHAPRRR